MARGFLLAAALVVAGCQGLSLRAGEAEPALAQVQAPQAEPAPAPLPFPEPAREGGELTPDAIYSFLVGEIASDRGELRLAYNHYLHSALLTEDPYAAERATRIALRMKDNPAAKRAALRWVELAPNAIAARQALVHVLLRVGDSEAAMEQVRALLRIAEALNEDGFLQAASVLGHEDGATGVALMRQLVSEHPDNAKAHYAVALVLSSAKAHAEAEPHLRRAIAIEPSWHKPRLLLVQVLVSTDRMAEARDALKDTLEQNPDDVPLRTAYARLLLDAKELEAAYEQFRILQVKAPKDADVQVTAALVAMQLERWGDARETWKALISAGQRTQDARYFLAQTEEHAGDAERAAALYGEITDGPYRADAAIRRAGMLAKQDRLGEARELLKGTRAADADRAVDLYVAEADLLNRHGTREQALELYRLALQSHPDDADLLYSRALVYSQLGRVPEAEADLLKVIAKEPDNADAYNALGYTLADLTGRYAEALDLIEKALRLKPDTGAFLDSMGWVQYRLGNHAVALDYLKRAYAKLKDPEVAAHLGEVLWVTGQRDEARRVWQEAAKEHADDPVLRQTVQRLDPSPG
jgi:tetratricopeptide (TPR) repeat protein